MTAPPRERFAGTLDHTPRAYRHSVCGVVTEMPEEIIRTYLVNPLTYGDQSFCCGCGEYVDSSQLTWEETGDIVMAYMGLLRRQYMRETLGMEFPARPKGVILTPSAIQKLKDRIQEIGIATLCAEIIVPEAPSSEFQFGLKGAPNEQLDVLMNIGGVRVAVKRKQIDQIDGIVIEYFGPPKDGFSIGRLYPLND